MTSLLLELGYLAEDATAAALGIEPKTLETYRKEGSGPEHAVVGRSIYYSREAIAVRPKAGGGWIVRMGVDDNVNHDGQAVRRTKGRQRTRWCG